jgi:hypothetical protein
MNLLEHAKQEMRAAGFYDKDAAYDGMIPQAVEEIVKTFAAQGHSGMSASIVIGILEKVLQRQPLCPLTGKPEEWTDVTAYGDGTPMYQNKRCSRVFARGPNGEGAFDTEGKIFQDVRGECFTNRDSHVPVTFPYTPVHEYVKMQDGESIYKGDKAE